MLNQVIIAGIVKETPILKETNAKNHYANLLLEVQREYRNNEGNYDIDVFNVLVWRNIAEQCVEICKEGNMVAVKGRLQSSVYNREDGSVFYNYDIMAEKVFVLDK